VLVDSAVVDKLNRKHQVTAAQVIEAFEWPAHARAGLEDHPEHGERWVAVGTTANGRRIIGWLVPIPEWEPMPDTWKISACGSAQKAVYPPSTGRTAPVM
jgi:hypothetical protein